MVAEEEVAVVEEGHVHGAHLMTAGDALPQEVDPGLEVEAQDLVVVHEIVQNTGLALNPALILQTEQTEMVAQHLVLDPGQGNSQDQGLGLRI